MEVPALARTASAPKGCVSPVDATATVAQGLGSDPPTWLALVEASVVIKNTSGAPASAAWLFKALTASGLRSMSNVDLGEKPGFTIHSPIVPVTMAAGESDVFSVGFLCQFPKALSGAQFAFASSAAGAIQPVSSVLVQVVNAAFRPSVTYPDGWASNPLPTLDPANPMGPLIPPAAPTSYPVTLLDWV